MGIIIRGSAVISSRQRKKHPRRWTPRAYDMSGAFHSPEEASRCATAHAIPKPSQVDVPRPNSSTITRDPLISTHASNDGRNVSISTLLPPSDGSQH